MCGKVWNATLPCHIAWTAGICGRVTCSLVCIGLEQIVEQFRLKFLVAWDSFVFQPQSQYLYLCPADVYCMHVYMTLEEKQLVHAWGLIDQASIGGSYFVIYACGVVHTVGFWSDLLGGVQRWLEALCSRPSHWAGHTVGEWIQDGETTQCSLLGWNVRMKKNIAQS